jgi:hypothetical protein|tara:strand:- start:379 stop:756 length:378 start_codon:yes stop_codon:yes gene_type:complete
LVVKFGLGLWIVPVCIVVFGLTMTLSTLTIVYRAAKAGQVIYAPSGNSTPRKKEYSYAESLGMRGEYEDAVSAYELIILEEDVLDPTPYLRIARIAEETAGTPEGEWASGELAFVKEQMRAEEAS